MEQIYNNQLLYTKNEKRCSSVERNQIVMSYDREADVIYISFSKPRKAVSEEIDPYVLVRRDPKNQGNPRHNHNQLQQILRSKKEAKHKSPCIMNYKPVSFTSCLGKSLQTSTTVLLLLPTIKSAPRFYVRSNCLSFFPNHSSNQQNWCITVVNYGSSQRKAFGWLLHVIE